ncbi:ferritin-like domain-containing protein [Rhodococcus chondri]|uniref:Ferritin-like domain-containing protein n=1 Tax=Rhodococcus chondri TaxID=3065941 RepID=A0ABU7JTS2_9NOCA|nr:ferritin-like domain-containing protein [Rhodococcus sp. CC-R104]MEE2033420.1 ferritin-like domain-containing protein [Rhodococcus sp. CC-R104]
MTTPNNVTNAALITQLRALHELTHAETQVAEIRTVQARTEAVRKELTENAAHSRVRAVAIEEAIRRLGGLPDVLGPFVGRATTMVKTFTEQAQPFDEALLGDLFLEQQLLGRSRYLKALATAARQPSIVSLADKLITAHSATVEWLTTVLAEEALGGPAALRRTPFQAVAGTAVRIVNAPVVWSARGLDRAIDAARSAGPRIETLLSRGAHAGDVAAKTLGAGRDAALETAERVSRREGADSTADALHSIRSTTGVLTAEELPIRDYENLNVSKAVAAVKELDEPADIRAVVAYEEAHKNRHGVVSAAQTRLAAIAQDVLSV